MSMWTGKSVGCVTKMRTLVHVGSAGRRIGGRR
jgi:hypothetical protein